MELVDIRDSRDPLVGAVARLLLETFADPNTVLDEHRMREFLSQTEGERTFSILALTDGAALAGASIFSYVPRSNCGFSEYLAVRAAARGQGLGRLLFDARKTRLDGAARAAGSRMCNGLFIEAENPRRTPLAVLQAERQTAVDADERLRIFGHLGFFRVDTAYVQPPLGAGKERVDYLDLLFAPWVPLSLPDIPSAWVVDTLAPVWRAWAGDGVALPRLSHARVRLQPLP